MFDVLVIGGGHAGVEAACASARRGARTGIVTMSVADIGRMSCNPSIGGVGKGHLVREIDALGGVMAKAADEAAIHHRMLNASKGAAVRGPRVQADRSLFAQATRKAVVEVGVETIAGEVSALVIGGGRITGVALTDGSSISCSAVVLATGTFLGATLFRGEERWEGGRLGDPASRRLAGQIRELGLADARLKTGTPPRLDGRTIDWARLMPQPSDEAPWSLSLRHSKRLPQLSCAITRTNARSHDVIRAGLERSPLFSGDIEGRGPRYCPSIEDKVLRFGDRDGHQIFLEPEGLDDVTVYPNGISTSLPTDVQEDLIRSINGLERAEITAAGYAVEYDYADPRLLNSSLEHRDVLGLFLAGQINGTTGYEEAGAQGLLAGANASAGALGQEKLLLDRSESYLGVMVDDLILQGVSEPYRMLTARAEHRLYLRSDNAVARLSPKADRLGLLTPEVASIARSHLDRKAECSAVLEAEATAQEIGVQGNQERMPLRKWLLRRETREQIRAIVGRNEAAEEAMEDAQYAPYVDRQTGEIAAREKDKLLLLPPSLDFNHVPGLSNEARERLSLTRPETLEQASRVRGVTPAAVAALHFAIAASATR